MPAAASSPVPPRVPLSPTHANQMLFWYFLWLSVARGAFPGCYPAQRWGLRESVARVCQRAVSMELHPARFASLSTAAHLIVYPPLYVLFVVSCPVFGASRPVLADVHLRTFLRPC